MIKVLERLRELERAATAAPWEEREGEIVHRTREGRDVPIDGGPAARWKPPVFATVFGGGNLGTLGNADLNCSKEDIAFVVALRNAFPSLVAEQAKAAKTIEWLEQDAGRVWAKFGIEGEETAYEAASRLDRAATDLRAKLIEMHAVLIAQNVRVRLVVEAARAILDLPQDLGIAMANARGDLRDALIGFDGLPDVGARAGTAELDVIEQLRAELAEAEKDRDFLKGVCAGEPKVEESRKRYASRRPWVLEPHYSGHVVAMTTEKLHAKADIAAELAFRDARIASLEFKLGALHKREAPEAAWQRAWVKAQTRFAGPDVYFWPQYQPPEPARESRCTCERAKPVEHWRHDPDCPEHGVKREERPPAVERAAADRAAQARAFRMAAQALRDNPRAGAFALDAIADAVEAGEVEVPE